MLPAEHSLPFTALCIYIDDSKSCVSQLANFPPFVLNRGNIRRIPGTVLLRKLPPISVLYDTLPRTLLKNFLLYFYLFFHLVYICRRVHIWCRTFVFCFYTTRCELYIQSTQGRQQTVLSWKSVQK